MSNPPLLSSSFNPPLLSSSFNPPPPLSPLHPPPPLSSSFNPPPPLSPPPPPPLPQAGRGDNKKRARGSSSAPSTSSSGPAGKGVARESDRASVVSESETTHPRKKANLGNPPVRTGPRPTAINNRQPQPSWLAEDFAYTAAGQTNRATTTTSSSSSSTATPYQLGSAIIIRATEHVLSKYPELAQTSGVIESIPVMPPRSTHIQ